MQQVSEISEKAVTIARIQPQALNASTQYPTYNWQSQDVDPFESYASFNPVYHITDIPEPQAVRLVCWCNSKKIGLYWEVHTDSREAYYVNDDAELKHKYGIHTP